VRRSLVGALLAGCFNSAFYTMLPAMLSQLGKSAADIAGFMGMALLAAPLLQWPMGKWADSSDRAQLLAYSAMVVAGLSLVLILLTGTGWMLPLVMVYVAIAFTFTARSAALPTMPCRHATGGNQRIPADGVCAGRHAGALAVLGGDGIRRAVIYWCRSLAWRPCWACMRSGRSSAGPAQPAAALSDGLSPPD
jgi:MFS family permease